MNIESKIAAVTVYKDRALVKRSAKIELTSGEHILTFTNLPSDIDADTIQVHGSKQLILQDLKVQDTYVEEIIDGSVEDLKTESEDLENQIAEVNEKIRNSSEERTFLVKVATSFSENSKKSLQALYEPQKMEDILQYYSRKLNTIDEDIRQKRKDLKALNKKLAILKEQVQKFSTRNYHYQKQVDLKVAVSDTSTIDLILSYIVTNASWTPLYDLRLNSDGKKLTVAYKAIVTQTTSESWTNVSLSLSTARLQISGTNPVLSPWYINFYHKAYPVAASAPMRAMRASKPAPAVDADYEAAACSVSEMGEPELQEVTQPDAAVETGATSVVFAIPGTTTILNNSDEHKVGITTLDLDAELEYSSIPKISPFAYLKAFAINTSDYPLLSGQTNIFLDNNFVSHSSIGLIAPNEKFDCSLGIDEGILIEHKLINKMTKDEGLFSKKIKISYDYKMIIKNHKSIATHISIKDQIPLPQHQDIKIELIEPKLKENSENLKKNDDNSIEWLFSLTPGEERKLDLKFLIEYPKDQMLTGL